MILCFVASKSAGFTSCTDAVWPGTVGQAIGVLVASVVSVFVIVPLAIKRSHDLGKSGHFLWLLLIPLYGVWPMIQLTFIKGEACSNQYGASPYDVIS